MSDVYFYEPANGHGLTHDPFKAIVAPRPIGWISTVNRDGVCNLAPYSFFNAVCSYPPIVAFANERASDSLANAEATGEFVVNMATAALAMQMSATSAMVGPEIDEFEMAGLARAPCRIVRAPRVADSPAALECKVLQITNLRDLQDSPTRVHLVLGQVVGVHINPDYLTDGKFDTAKAQPLARCGHLSDYAVVREMFDMPRPDQALLARALEDLSPR